MQNYCISKTLRKEGKVKMEGSPFNVPLSTLLLRRTQDHVELLKIAND